MSFSNEFSDFHNPSKCHAIFFYPTTYIRSIFHLLPIIENLREGKIELLFPLLALLDDIVSQIWRYAILYLSQRTTLHLSFLVSNLHYDFRCTLVVPRRERNLAHKSLFSSSTHSD